MGTKATEQPHSTTRASPTWLLNWFSQLTTTSTPTTKQSSSVILPWKKDSNKKALPASSIVITDPIRVPTAATKTNSNIIQGGSSIKTIKNNTNKRPSITISLSPSTTNNHDNQRRNSQQTNYSSSSDQSSFIATSRRDTSGSIDRASVLSEIWSKTKRNKKRHSTSSGNVSTVSSSNSHQPGRFQWPASLRHSNRLVDETYLRPSSSTSISAAADYYDSSLPSSYRQPTALRHIKRHSISSSVVNSTNDNTPSGSRPNSIILSSQPGSPQFTATTHLLNNFIVDPYYLSPQQQHDEYCCQHVNQRKLLRWEIKHELTKLAVDGLFSIPELVTPTSAAAIAEEKHILQIGCSDAAWGIDVAIQHSKWIVIRLDDEASHSNKTTSIPKNFTYINCSDLIQGLVNLHDNSFDFISSRFLILGYTFDQYQQLITECIRICKPGGYIEVMEMDLRIYHQRTLSNSVTQLLNSEVIKVIESKSLDPRLARKLNDLIVDETSIQSFQIKYISLPLGVWGGKLGVMFRDDVHTLITSFQGDVATWKEKSCRTEDELDYKLEIMDDELDSNRAFMNLHLMVIHV